MERFDGERTATSRVNRHYARDAVARSWRWLCHRATLPRYRGTGPEAYLSVRRKVRDPRTPGFRLGNTGRRRRQGHLRNKAHPEPLRSPRWKAGLPDSVSHPATRQGLTSILSMTRLCAFVEQITLPRAIRSRLEAAPTAFLLTEPSARKEGRPYPRSQQMVRA